MNKALLKYLLSVCILLLCGYSLFSAHTDKGSAFYSSITVFESAHATLGLVHQDQTFISSPSSSESKKEKNKIEVAEKEVEESESVSSRKYLESSNYFTAIFYALALGYLFRYITAGLHFCKHFSYQSSNKRYLILQVFRI